MLKLLSDKKTANILLIATIVVLIMLLITALRPVSYEMEYYSDKDVAGIDFECSYVFHRSEQVTIDNSNYATPMTYYFYNKLGYVFIGLSTTEQDHAAEVEKINEDFEGALRKPFYASRINAFTCSNDDGSDEVVLVCLPAVILAGVLGVITLGLGALTITSYKLSNKVKKENNRR